MLTTRILSVAALLGSIGSACVNQSAQLSRPPDVEFITSAGIADVHIRSAPPGKTRAELPAGSRPAGRNDPGTKRIPMSTIVPEPDYDSEPESISRGTEP